MAHRRGAYHQREAASTPGYDLADDDALDGESPTVVATYDERGIYGHPDHVAVRCVGRHLARAGLAVCESKCSGRWQRTTPQRR